MKKTKSTRADVLLLTVANFIKSALRFLIPIILVRILDKSEFGEYRLFWLVANTVMLIAPLGMNNSLLYFLPRSTPEDRARIVNQTIFYLLVVGVLIAALLTSAPSWLPESVNTLTNPAWLLPAFVLLWFVSSLIRFLPNADQDVTWQAYAIVFLAVVRAAIVIGTALVTKDLQMIIWSLMAFVAVQCIVFGYYVGTRYGLRLKLPTVAGMRSQLEYAVPFGMAGTLARSRRQVEQWIVAYLFSPGTLAVFSIGLSFNAILHLLRSSVGNVLLPKMSRRHAAGDTQRALQLNNRGNIVICLLVYPTASFVWVFAPSLVEFLFTASYLDAVPIVRIYVITLLIMSIELATVLMILEQGKHVAKVSASVLVLAAFLSFAGAHFFGLVGVVAGSVVGTFITRAVNFRRAAAVLGIPFSRLQDWSTLGRILLAAAASGIISFVATDALLGSSSPFTRIVIGAALFALAYAAMLYVLRLTWVVKSMLGSQGWSRS